MRPLYVDLDGTLTATDSLQEFSRLAVGNAALALWAAD